MGVLMEILIFIFALLLISIVTYQIFSLLGEKFYHLQRRKLSEIEKKLDEMFMLIERKKLLFYYTLSPLLLMGVAFILFKNFIVVLVAGFLGLSLPTLVLKYLEKIRKDKIRSQLLDGLMVLSSCLKGGLSILQAIEVLVEEMPPPISQEFGLVLRENKMGITLEESLRKMNERLKIEELSMVITSVLVARETGGDLTKVFSRLTTTLRDNAKLIGSIRNLTLQGRIQGMVMTILPFIFVSVILSLDRHYFDIMLSTEKGRFLLLLAGVLQIVGIILIRRFSSIR
jgi:tight adherence protein B